MSTEKLAFISGVIKYESQKQTDGNYVNINRVDWANYGTTLSAAEEIVWALVNRGDYECRQSEIFTDVQGEFAVLEKQTYVYSV